MLATPKDCMNFSKKIFAPYGCKYIILYINIICAIKAADRINLMTYYSVWTTNVLPRACSRIRAD